jgi:hypothetical protein
MTSPEPADPGDTRLSDLGDVEVFDGHDWTPLQSIIDDPNDGSRGDPGRTAYGSVAPDCGVPG